MTTTPSDPATVSTAAPTAKLRILVADDNQDAAASLSILLQLEGYEVETAYDGLQAVAKATAFAPDLVILDIGMPGLNGHDAARAIRKQCTHPLRLIALTGWGQQNDRQLSQEAGFDAHLVKPVEFSTLLTLLGGWSPRAQT